MWMNKRETVMSAIELVRALLLAAGCLFFAVGTLGLFRLPDTSTRLHALTKVDNLGLGLIVLGLLPGAESVPTGLKLVLIWLVALAASATAAHLVARAVRVGEEPDA
jgi:multicomponent Na+:H+ antiporter subunit G